MTEKFKYNRFFFNLCRLLLLLVLSLSVMGETCLANDSQFLPGQPSLLKSSTMMQKADGSNVMLPRGGYVRVRKVNGSKAHVATISGTGEIELQALFSIAELQKNAETWLAAVDHPSPAPEAVMFALYSNSVDAEHLIQLLPEDRQQRYAEELAFHQKVAKTLEKPSMYPVDTDEEKIDNDTLDRRQKFQKAYLTALGRRSSPEIDV